MQDPAAARLCAPGGGVGTSRIGAHGLGSASIDTLYPGPVSLETRGLAIASIDTLNLDPLNLDTFRLGTSSLGTSSLSALNPSPLSLGALCLSPSNTAPNRHDSPVGRVRDAAHFTESTRGYRQVGPSRCVMIGS